MTKAYMRKVKLGILGCGAIAQYAHLDAARQSQRVELAAVCDQAEDLLAQVASEYAVPQTYTDHGEFLTNRDVEAVVLAVPDVFHVPLALECLAAGKHVLVEKPVAATSAEAEKLLAAVEGTPLKVLVGNMKRHDPGVEFARRFITQKMGTPLSVSAWYCDTTLRPKMQEELLPPLRTSGQQKHPPVDPRADREAYSLLTHGVHLVNLVQYLGGPVARVLGGKRESFGAYTWHALFEHGSGAVGHFELTVKIRAPWSEGFVVHGEFGSVSGKMFFPFLRKSAEVTAFDVRTGLAETATDSGGDAYRRQMDSFARSIVEDQPLACTVAEGVHDLRVLEALKRSLESKHWETV